MEKIKEILEKITQNGGKLYLVGGAVRDKILGNEIHDRDYCVTGIDSVDFEKIFPNAIKRGKSFPVYDIDGMEFAMARIEKKRGNKHTDFSIVSNREITIFEDLKRRDITINSIAEDVETGELVDPFNGLEDLKKGIIRATSECFKEDALRAYRAARFASQFDFSIEEDTLKYMKELKTDLKYISPERVFDEFRKALNTKNPEKFFDVLKKADILEVHFIEIYKLIGAIQPEKYHPEGDSYNHTMLALKMASKLSNDEKIRFSALVHDLGKGVTPKEEYPHHYGHDKKGVDEVRKLGRRLKMPNSWIKCGMVSASEHMLGGIFYKMNPNKQVDFIERVAKSELGLKGLEIVVESDRNCRGLDNESKVKFADLGEQIIRKINGEYVLRLYPNLKPGKELKERIRKERIKYLKSIDI